MRRKPVGGGRVCVAVACLGATLGHTAPLCGEELRIRTEFYSGNAAEATSENLTLFYGGKVYDYISPGGEATTFDPATGRFVLLDPRRQVQCEVFTSRLEQEVARLRSAVRERTDPRLRFLADPVFEVTWDEAAGELALSSGPLTYDVQTQPEPDETLRMQYFAFSDHFARLNALLSRGASLPFARLQVNQALAERKAIPTRVRVTHVVNRTLLPDRRTTLETRHDVTRQLSDDDRRRIKETSRHMVTYDVVSFETYLGPTNRQAKR